MGHTSKTKPLWTLLAEFVLAVLVVIGVPVALHFPRATDKPLSAAELAQTRDFYARAYTGAAEDKPDPRQEIYVRVAELAAQEYKILEKVTEFVTRHQLGKSKILDVGAGRGQLQDLVGDYTGLDISSSARRFYHKPFVQGSATAMPFQDNTFDAAWSVWVLEHVPNPEQMLREMRRVVKNGGLLYLRPAWDCTPWAAQGLDVRSYADLDWRGKLVKASIPPRRVLIGFSKPPIRLLRYLWIRGSRTPSTLHYTKLEPNYEKFMEPDSDAVNSLDRHETALWFVSRGDECLNCGGAMSGVNDFEADSLVIRLKK